MSAGKRYPEETVVRVDGCHRKRPNPGSPERKNQG